MNTEKIGIATARINGLTKSPYYFDSKCFWAWQIMFSDTSTSAFANLPWIFVSEDSEEEAEKECNKLKKHFSDAGIYDRDRVAVMFKRNGSIRAIGSLGRDCWIDVNDRFTVKTFKELDIVITSLSVH